MVELEEVGRSVGSTGILLFDVVPMLYFVYFGFMSAFFYRCVVLMLDFFDVLKFGFLSFVRLTTGLDLALLIIVIFLC